MNVDPNATKKTTGADPSAGTDGVTNVADQTDVQKAQQAVTAGQVQGQARQVIGTQAVDHFASDGTGAGASTGIGPGLGQRLTPSGSGPTGQTQAGPGSVVALPGGPAIINLNSEGGADEGGEGEIPKEAGGATPPLTPEEEIGFHEQTDDVDLDPWPQGNRRPEGEVGGYTGKKIFDLPDFEPRLDDSGAS